VIADPIRQQARDAVDDFLFWLARKRRQAAQGKPKPKRRTRRPHLPQQVFAWLAERGEATTQEICEQFNMSDAGVRNMQHRHSERMIKARTIPGTKKGSPPVILWKVVG
jgi:hypothetical protein